MKLITKSLIANLPKTKDSLATTLQPTLDRIYRGINVPEANEAAKAIRGFQRKLYQLFVPEPVGQLKRKRQSKEGHSSIRSQKKLCQKTQCYDLCHCSSSSHYPSIALKGLGEPAETCRYPTSISILPSFSTDSPHSQYSQSFTALPSESTNVPTHDYQTERSSYPYGRHILQANGWGATCLEVGEYPQQLQTEEVPSKHGRMHITAVANT